MNHWNQIVKEIKKDLRNNLGAPPPLLILETLLLGKLNLNREAVYIFLSLLAKRFLNLVCT